MNEKVNTSVYYMQLHEVISLELSSGGPSVFNIVTRVPGGWIYTTKVPDAWGVTSVFVPFTPDPERP